MISLYIGQVLEQDGLLTFSPRGVGDSESASTDKHAQWEKNVTVAEAFVRSGRYPRE